MNMILSKLPTGSVFTVVSPKVEGRKNVLNNSIYRKEGDSHCIQLSNGKDCIFASNTVVTPIQNSRFSK